MLMKYFGFMLCQLSIDQLIFQDESRVYRKSGFSRDSKVNRNFADDWLLK